MVGCIIVAIILILIGLYFVAEGIWWFGLIRAGVVKLTGGPTTTGTPTPEKLARAACVIAGLGFIILSILVLAKVIPCNF